MKNPLFTSNGCWLCIALLLLNLTSVQAQCNTDFIYSVHDSSNTAYFTNVSTSDTGVSYYWQFGDNTTSTLSNPSHTYSGKGSYNACIIRTDSLCRDTICKTILIVPDICVLGFTYTKDYKTGRVHFYNYSVGEAKDFTWIFADATSSVGTRHASHYYNFMGHFEVCLYRSNSRNNCATSTCQTIRVPFDSCAVNFYPIIDQETKTVTFHNYEFPLTDTAFTWHFGDSSTSRLVSPVHTYKSFGTYQVCLAKNEPLCSKSLCRTLLIDGRYPCTVSFDQLADTADPNRFYFNNRSKGRNLVYRWEVKETGASATTEHFDYRFVKDGFYTVCLTILESDSFCSSSNCTRLLIYSDTSGCAADFTFSPTSNKRIMKFNNQTGGTHKVSYWDFGDGSYSTERSLLHVFDSAGTFKVCLVVYDTLIECTDTLCKTITIVPDSATGLNHIPGFEQLLVYPVPFLDQLNISFNTLADHSLIIRVINQAGITLHSLNKTAKAGSNVFEVNTKDLPPGLYFIELQTNEYSSIIKVAK